MKARFDLTPTLGDLTAPIFTVDHVDAKGRSLGVWTNPCLCHFVVLPEIFILDDLKDYILNKLFTPDNVATLDNIFLRPDSAHYVAPFIQKIPKFTTQKVLTKDTLDMIGSINVRLAPLSIPLKKGIALPVKPESIDIGAGATDRASSTDMRRTLVDKNNSANATGTITVWQIFANLTMNNVSMGTVSVVSDNNLSSSDYESLGSCAGGGIETFTGLDNDVTLGDYVGAGADSGFIERDSSGDGYWYSDIDSDDLFPFTNTAFSFSSDRTASFYGTGTETAVGIGAFTKRLNLFGFNDYGARLG